MLKKAYLEITNICNLSCSFCHGTKRQPRSMSIEEFTHAAEEIRPYCGYLYFHLMGEPLTHPLLGEFLRIAGGLGFRVIITTNGTLLPKRGDLLVMSSSLHKVSVSLHSFESNDTGADMHDYLEGCFSFCSRAAQAGKISVMRLWNIGGEDTLNAPILSYMHEYFPGEWKQTYSGYKLRERVFLEWGEHFEWPDEECEEMDSAISCYGLRDQIGVLSDGTVVPCCLDADGSIPLGNIFDTPLSEILSCERAAALRRSFEMRHVTEPLCLRCGYAHQKKY